MQCFGSKKYNLSIIKKLIYLIINHFVYLKKIKKL